jgi:ATP-dependent DNA helicase RecQ
MASLQNILQQYFGYTSFRPLQEQIITDIMSRKDVFVLMPTGGGKSLCYQLPSVAQDGTTIVVSPLISLMKDQVDGLVQNGIRAAYLNSSLLPEEQLRVLDKLQTNNLSLLYVAPERLVQEQFLYVLKNIKINFFAIDEAHCISQWGHDFRPEYRQLDLIKKEFPDKPLMALTATATPRVRNDIIERLHLDGVSIYSASFNRPNLLYRVVRKSDAFAQAIDIISAHKGESGVVYCQSRKTVESVAGRLQKTEIKALPYHAGLPDEERKKNQERFIHEDVEVIVATIAFGMGIDKPNVRYVLHYDLPRSIENYYQETGRAGRDGLASECVLLYSYGDKFFYDRFIAEKTEEEQRIAKAQMRRMIDFAQSKICRRAQLLQYFAESFPEKSCGACDNCLSPAETIDGTVIAQKILSCVYRTQQRFGVTHIVRILTGSKDKNVLLHGHHLLSTYGIIEEYGRGDVKTFIYELIQQGYLRQSEDQYGILFLTPKSGAVLKRLEKVRLTKPEERVIKKVESEEEKDLKIDEELFQQLRRLRKKLADRQNVPPYVIFSDKSLKDMAGYFPQTLEQFSGMYGVGEEKLKKYGEIFMKEIAAYCKPRGISALETSRKKKFRRND